MVHKDFLYIITSIIGIIITYSVFFLFDNETIRVISGEDGLFEIMTAIFFFMASILFFYLYFKDNIGNNFYILKTKKNIFFLLLGILFLFGAGEEISWGQRIFDIQTPQSLKGINIQHELNIHNIAIFHGDMENGRAKTGLAKLITIGGLFRIFWFTYCFLISLMNKTSSNISKILKTINLPIVPMWMGILFVLNYIISRIVNFQLDNLLLYYVVENKESVFAFLFFILAIYFIRYYKMPIPLMVTGHSGDRDRLHIDKTLE